MDIEKAITEGIVFKGGKSPSGKQEDKVKTKAKKKSYITGLQWQVFAVRCCFNK